MSLRPSFSSSTVLACGVPATMTEAIPSLTKVHASEKLMPAPRPVSTCDTFLPLSESRRPSSDS